MANRERAATRPWGLVLGLLLVCLPWVLWRASLEQSFWIDETYSVLLTTYPVAQLVDLTAADLHPPAYYLLLKAWLKVGRLFGEEPGVLWARLLNVGLWLAGLAAVAWTARRRLPATGAALLTAALVTAASPALLARDLRSYVLAVLGLTLAWLALWDRLEGAEEGRAAACWGIFAAGAALAVWSHLLAAVALAALVLVWLGLAAAQRRLGRRQLVGLTLATAAVLLSFAPWLPRVLPQLGHLQAGLTSWMTPPTATNLGLVFGFWYPFGRVGGLDEPINRMLLPLGLLACALPLALAALAAWRRVGQADPRWQRLGTLAAGTASLFVLSLWGLDRLGVAPIFDGPRYTLLTAPLWTVALVAWASWAVARLGWRPYAAVGVLAPWLLAGLVGQVYLGIKEASWGLGRHLPSQDELLPAAGEPLYVMPQELLPFYRRSLADHDPRPLGQLPCEIRNRTAASVLNVNFWPGLDRPRDHLARALLEAGQLAASTRSAGFPERQRDYRLYRLTELRTPRLEALCASGFVPAGREALATAAAVALPENQPSSPAWSFLETTPERELYRWATGRETRLRFDRPVPPGTYRLHVVGDRAAPPAPSGPMRFRLAGAPPSSASPAPGRFHVTLDVRLDRTGTRPELVVEHETWRPAELLGSKDARTLSFLFRSAWLEPVSAP
jgi:hypothetical protein